MEHWLNGTDRGRLKCWYYNRCYVLCPPQIQHRLAFDRIQASVIKGRRLLIWAARRTFIVGRPATCRYNTHVLKEIKRTCDTRTVCKNMAGARTSEVEATPATCVRYWMTFKQETFVNVHFVEEHGVRLG